MSVDCQPPDLRRRPGRARVRRRDVLTLESAKGAEDTWFSRSERPSSTRTTVPRSSRRSRLGRSRARKRKYLVLKVAQGDLTVRVPAENAEVVGVRDVVGQEGLDRVFEVLRAPHTEEPTNWSRRYKANLEKLASGDVNKVAEVVRDLWRREKDRGLSAGEKRMLAKARQILVSELALAEGTDEERAEVLLDEVLATADRLSRLARRRGCGAVAAGRRHGPRRGGRCDVSGDGPEAFVDVAGVPMVVRAVRGLLDVGRRRPRRRGRCPARRVSGCPSPVGGLPVSRRAGGADRSGVGAGRAGRRRAGRAIVLVHDAARPLAPPALVRRRGRCGAPPAPAPCAGAAGDRHREARGRRRAWCRHRWTVPTLRVGADPAGLRADVLRRAHAPASTAHRRRRAASRRSASPVHTVAGRSVGVQRSPPRGTCELAELLLAGAAVRR